MDIAVTRLARSVSSLPRTRRAGRLRRSPGRSRVVVIVGTVPNRTERGQRADSSTESRSGRGGRWALLAVAVVAVAALSLGGWLLIRPTPDGEESAVDYSDAQQADAKVKICAAHSLVSNAVNINTKMAPPGGDGDVTGALAVAANARMSLFFGGQYLLAKLDPATPTELANEVRTFANNLLDIGAAATAGVPNADPVQSGRLTDTDAINNKIVDLCK